MLGSLELESQAPERASPDGEERTGASEDERLVASSESARSGGWASRAASLVTSSRAVNASWVVNWALFFIKLVVYISSNSKAVLAALADSAVDLASQAVLAVAARYMKRHDARYPVGRGRLEAVGVLGCACIMSMAAVEVVQYSCSDIAAGVRGDIPALSVGPSVYISLSLGILAKLLLWALCRAAGAKQSSDLLAALAEDHMNDVWSNSGAVVTGAIAGRWAAAWWIDPAGGIAISLVIIARWLHLTYEQLKKLTGHTAPPEFIARVNALAAAHSTQLALDCTRAYHFGARFNVEMEIVLPGDMTVAESHDIALALQHKIEELDEVERAFVHVDYLPRDGLEHKVERELMLGDAASSITSSLQQRGPARGSRVALDASAD